MKQNRYDDPVFFEQYSQMARSQQGLAGAGEWPALRQMLPENLTGMRVLDLGCGYGWHCRYLMEQGAKRVLGIDLSHRMLERAAEINQLPGITYRQAAMEDLRQGKTDDTPPKAAWLQAAFLLPKGKKRAEDGCSQPGGGV